MLLEADMEKREYYRCQSELETKSKARKHMQRLYVSKKLKSLIEIVILPESKEVKLTIEQMMRMVKLIKFRTWGMTKRRMSE